ncbi:MAG TPA: hypothetical protein VM165_04155 [Planctomycetaceae bacterium]|nr:hypothetical protein [Planctomycetaceae bacterium]
MAYLEFLWLESVLEKLDDRGLSTEDVEEVIRHPVAQDYSQSTGRPVAFGYTSDDRYFMAVYETIDEFTVQPFSAYVVPEPR